VTVQNMTFDENRARPGTPLPARIYANLRSSTEILKYLCLTVGVLIVVFFGIRPALKQVLPSGTHQGLMAAEAGGKLLQQPADPHPYDANRARAQEIFEKVRSQMKSEPAQSSRLLQSWIRSD